MTTVGRDPHGHPDDELHEPTGDDPWWRETCWFTFTVPERRLSGQLYPFMAPTLGVAAAGAYVWDDTGSTPETCLYAKNHWHLPLPDQPLSDITFANGIRYRCTEAQRTYEVRYDDPDGDELHVELTFTGVAAPHRLGDSHIDQPGRYRGTLVLRGEEIPVDAYGFRDRSWGSRPQVGPGIHGTPFDHGGYSYATASDDHGFHMISMDLGEGCTSIHGHLLRDGRWSALASGTREVLARDDTTGHPTRVRVEGVDEDGRALEAEGTCLNHLAFPINPNLFTVNALVAWELDGVVAHGEDHDNWSAAGIRAFHRARRGG